MKRIDKPLKDLEQTATAINLPEAESRLAEAREFMAKVMKRNGHFTRYSITTGYRGSGALGLLNLKVYFMGDSPLGHTTTEAYSEMDVYNRNWVDWETGD